MGCGYRYLWIPTIPIYVTEYVKGVKINSLKTLLGEPFLARLHEKFQ